MAATAVPDHRLHPRLPPIGDDFGKRLLLDVRQPDPAQFRPNRVDREGEVAPSVDDLPSLPNLDSPRCPDPSDRSVQAKAHLVAMHPSLSRFQPNALEAGS